MAKPCQKEGRRYTEAEPSSPLPAANGPAHRGPDTRIARSSEELVTEVNSAPIGSVTAPGSFRIWIGRAA